MNLNSPGTSTHHNAERGTGKPKWWFRRARSGATLAACLYVVVWSALLGDFSDSLSGAQEMLMAVAALSSGVLVWMAVRALILQQKFLARQESMEALEESRAFIRALMDNLPVAVWLKTLDHRYQAANLMWAQYNPARPTWTDRSLAHLLGHTDRELYESERAREFEQTDDIVVATGRRWEREYTETHGDGQIKFQVIKIPVFDVRGSVVSVAGIGFDVTELRREEHQTQRSQEQVDMFLKRSPEHVCVLNLDRTIDFANLRMCEFLGTYPSELRGKDLADLVTSADRDHMIAFIEQTVADGSAGYEVVHVANAAGELRLLQISGVLVTTTHSPHSVIVLGRDVTDRTPRGASSD
ncbi:MAG: PAS domain-containing protein [Candidatus Cryosericum sp.]